MVKSNSTYLPPLRSLLLCPSPPSSPARVSTCRRSVAWPCTASLTTLPCDPSYGRYKNAPSSIEGKRSAFKVVPLRQRVDARLDAGSQVFPPVSWMVHKNLVNLLPEIRALCPFLPCLHVLPLRSCQRPPPITVIIYMQFSFLVLIFL